MNIKHLFIILAFAFIFSACSKLRPQKAGIQVVSNTSATVELDGVEVGKTPYTATDLKAKKYTLSLKPSDSSIQPHETSVRLAGGFQAMVDWVFGKTKDESSGVILQIDDAQNKNKAEIEITAVPDNVPVSVDGQTKGFTPLLLDDLSEGKHTIQLQAPSFEPLARDVVLMKGKRLLLSIKLAKKTAPSPTPIATESAQLATPSATIKPKATAKPTASPALKVATTSATPASAGVLTKSTTKKPYVEILTTPTGWLKVRSDASVNATELAKLSIGSTVPYLNASASGWLKVEYNTGASGWVSGQYAKLFP